MVYTKLSDSELTISRIVMGTWAIGGWMWGGTDKNESVAAIRTALESGMTSIDTAPAYGFGLSEQIVGEAIKGFDRSKVQILTKYGLRWDLQKGKFYFVSKDSDGSSKMIFKYSGIESVIEECENSLKRLGTDYIDLYQIHWPDSTTPIDETMEGVSMLLQQGKIRAAGVCNYDFNQLDQALKSVNIVSNQVPYSMLERGIEKELIPYCLQNNKGILAYSPLQRGILTGKFTSESIYKEGDHRKSQPYYKVEALKEVNHFLDAIKPIAEKHAITLTQLVIAWTLAQPGIKGVLVGGRTSYQVTENVAAADAQLTNSDLQFVNSELQKLLKKSLW